jgi:hypothetical protein
MMVRRDILESRSAYGGADMIGCRSASGQSPGSRYRRSGRACGKPPPEPIVSAVISFRRCIIIFCDASYQELTGSHGSRFPLDASLEMPFVTGATGIADEAVTKKN